MTTLSRTLFIPRLETRPRPGSLPWWCDADAAQMPNKFLAAFPQSFPTPLHSLDALRRRLALGGLYVKDETSRLNLSSFKALGGAYAVFRIAHRLAQERLDRIVAPSELRSSAVRDVIAGMTVCCASDGNHGRSVAYGARLVGARCKVFLHAGVSEERVTHIERLGAEIIRVDGSYDDSVAAAEDAVRAKGWILVADIAAPSSAGAELSSFVMQGYAVMVEEILRESDRRGIVFSHVFVQAGVGGLAASVFGHWSALSSRLPKFTIVEPDRAACLTESARAGEAVTLPAGPSTIMAMLECQRPSLLAWPIVHALTDAYVTVDDADAKEAVRVLAWPNGTDPVIEAGESGAAGLAGLQRVLLDDPKALGLDRSSQVLVIATEGPTDRSAWSGGK